MCVFIDSDRYHDNGLVPVPLSFACLCRHTSLGPVAGGDDADGAAPAAPKGVTTGVQPCSRPAPQLSPLRDIQVRQAPPEVGLHGTGFRQ